MRKDGLGGTERRGIIEGQGKVTREEEEEG